MINRFVHKLGRLWYATAASQLVLHRSNHYGRMNHGRV
jgi:hypothetical protein